MKKQREGARKDKESLQKNPKRKPLSFGEVLKFPSSLQIVI
jgi:hypothetical protein